MIERHYFPDRDSDDYMWYVLDNPFDLKLCTLHENLHLILSNDEADPRQLCNYINMSISAKNCMPSLRHRGST